MGSCKLYKIETDEFSPKSRWYYGNTLYNSCLSIELSNTKSLLCRPESEAREKGKEEQCPRRLEASDYDYLVN